jgi:general secretion pathway protein D
MKRQRQSEFVRTGLWLRAARTLFCMANVAIAAQRESITPPAASNTPAAEPVPAQTTDTNLVTMNFHGAPLDQVLNHLSETAGFIINVKPGTSIRGKVDMFSARPMTKEEALDLLDTALNQNGLGAIRNGRTLTIVNKEDIKTQNIPVFQGSDPDKIPMTDRVVTQIMPVRFVEAGQLVKDLLPLVSLQTPMTANESGNSIIMTDTQANIHKVAEIVRAIDMGAEDFVEVRVFHLTNSSPVEMAELLTNLFPDDSKSGNSGSQSPFAGRFGRFFGGGGGGGGFPGFGGGVPGASSSGNGAAANNQNQRIKKRNRVIAVPDQRTTAIIVSANRDLMEQIQDVVTELDQNPHGRTTVKVIPLINADPQEVSPVLQDIFQSTTQNNRNQQNQNNNPLQSRSTTQGSSTTSQGSSATRSMGTTGGSRGAAGGGFGVGP